MTYENNHCPACGKAFTAGDDIVVCPDCGSPHHRACWQALGACVHASQHGSFTWEPDYVPEPDETAGARAEAQPCPRCGQLCAADALTCPRCGKQLGERTGEEGFAFNPDAFLRGVQADPQTDLGGMTVREAAMLVQFRVPDYMRKFLREGRIGWNWAAFLFSPFWFFYRKVYKAGALFLGVLMVFSVFLSIPVGRIQDNALAVVTRYVTIDENSTPEQITADIAALEPAQKALVQQALLRYSQSLLLFVGGLLVPNIAAAMTADGLYKKKLIRDTQSLRDFAENAKTFRMLALRRGGVSVLGMAACYLIVSLFFNLIFSYVQI